MTTRNIYDLAQTWDNGAVNFTAIKMNVTDTASAATSKLLDLQVGGVSKFNVDKTGLFFAGNASQSNLIGGLSGGLPKVIGRYSTSVRGSLVFALGTGHDAQLNAGDGGSWGSLMLSCASLELRRSTNAQAFNIYNTYTDASNYERGFMRWSSNVLEIGAEAAGTGAVRNVCIVNGTGGVFLVKHGATEVFQAKQFSGSNHVLYVQGVAFAQKLGGSIRLGNSSDPLILLTNNTLNISGTLPTSDPGVAGQVWNDAGTLKISL